MSSQLHTCNLPPIETHYVALLHNTAISGWKKYHIIKKSQDTPGHLDSRTNANIHNICTYTRAHTATCMHTYICKHIKKHKYTYIYMCKCLHIHTHIFCT